MKNSKQFSKPRFIELTRIDYSMESQPGRWYSEIVKHKRKCLFRLSSITALGDGVKGQCVLHTVTEKNIEIDGTYDEITALLCGVNDD